jgi:exodeoxyribonuclease X
MSQSTEKTKPPYILRTFDVETAGYIPPQPGDLIEIGWCDAVWNGDHFLVMPPSSILVKPDRPVTHEGMSVHHITEDDLAHAMTREAAMAYVQNLPQAVAYAAHHAVFELGVLPELAGEKWVCTHKCGAKLFPDAEKHTNQFLRYHLEVPLDRHMAQPPHRAAPDSYVTAHLLLRFLQETDLRTLLQISSQPLVMPRINHGDYRGKRWSDPEVPSSFLTWTLGKQGFSAEVHQACQRELDRRRGVSLGTSAAAAEVSPRLTAQAVTAPDAAVPRPEREAGTAPAGSAVIQPPPADVAVRAAAGIRDASKSASIFI